jgi:hypothetical protein
LRSAAALTLVASLFACHQEIPKEVLVDSGDSPVYKPAVTDYGKVRGAWVYAGDHDVRPAKGYKLVAADIELPPTDEKFDLDDIDIFNAETDENYGSDPLLYRLTPTGEFVDDQDPEVVNRREYRGIFIWQVPESVAVVNFGYWGEMLYREPVRLANTGLVAPTRDTRVPALGRGEPEGNYQKYVAVLEASNWYRVDDPILYTLFSPAGADGTDCDCDRWIEVDASLLPIARTVDELPYVVPKRRFLVEYWCPKDVVPAQLNFLGSKSPLPPVVAVAIPASTLEALRHGHLNSNSLHRLEEQERKGLAN